MPVSIETALVGLEYVALLIFIVAAFAPWFRPSKRTRPQFDPLNIVGSILNFAVKGAIAAALFEYFKNTTARDLSAAIVHKQKNVAHVDDDSMWQDALWILLFVHLLVYKISETAYYGKKIVKEGSMDLERLWCNVVYFLLIAVSVTVAVMLFMTGIYVGGSFHILVAVLYLVWLLILNCGSEQTIRGANALLHPGSTGINGGKQN